MNIARWKMDVVEKGQKVELSFKEFEQGTEGHYDFPFRNVSDADAEAALDTVGCDCSKVLVCTLPEDQWKYLRKAQTEKPGSPLPFTTEPAWTEFPTIRQRDNHSR